MVRIETFPRNIIDNFYKAFAKIAPVRVLMKIPRKEDLPEGLPKNVHVLPWMPQMKILRESQNYSLQSKKLIIIINFNYLIIKIIIFLF